jgi:CO dehydrogenase nickel-insertion accessory protein CooC1
VRTAGRISALADEVKLPARARGLIVNRVPPGPLPEAVRSEAEATGLALVATILLDQNVAAGDAEGAPATRIAADAPARAALDRLMEQTFTQGKS